MESVVDKLEALVHKSESDLNYVNLLLDSEFSQQFAKKNTEQLNPIKLHERIKRAREEFQALVSEAEVICIEKKKQQEAMVDCLVSCQNALQNLQQKTGCEISEKTALEDFFQQYQQTGSESQGELSSSQEEMDDDKENSPSESYDETEERAKSRKSLKEFIPITQDEFNGLSDLVKGRAQLDGVNRVYEVLFNHFKKNKKSAPLTASDMNAMGLKITGVTGQAKLKVLRSLKTIQITNKGAVKWQTQ